MTHRSTIVFVTVVLLLAGLMISAAKAQQI